MAGPALAPAASNDPGLSLVPLSDRPALRHPVVLIHGATVKGSNLKIGPFELGEYFFGIERFYAQTGTVVKVPEMPTDGTIGERAAVLKNYLETDLKNQMVNIIGHSLGGLDARYLVSVLRSTQVLSVTTIGTPHLGTPLADWAVSQINRNGFWYWVLRLFGYNMGSRRFLPEITTSGIKVFNENVPNSDEVRYFSVATRANYQEGTLSTFLWMPRRWLEGQGHPLSANGHDGMVPYDSMHWGVQIHPPSQQLDHLGQMNHHEGRLTTMKRESLLLYRAIYDTLLREGL